jgi:hypothetical protein
LRELHVDLTLTSFANIMKYSCQEGLFISEFPLY